MAEIFLDLCIYNVLVNRRASAYAVIPNVCDMSFIALIARVKLIDEVSPSHCKCGAEKNE
jgi:hypothetical protein